MLRLNQELLNQARRDLGLPVSHLPLQKQLNLEFMNNNPDYLRMQAIAKAKAAADLEAYLASKRQYERDLVDRAYALSQTPLVVDTSSLTPEQVAVAKHVQQAASAMLPLHMVKPPVPGWLAPPVPKAAHVPHQSKPPPKASHATLQPSMPSPDHLTKPLPAPPKAMPQPKLNGSMHPPEPINLPKTSNPSSHTGYDALLQLQAGFKAALTTKSAPLASAPTGKARSPPLPVASQQPKSYNPETGGVIPKTPPTPK
jgi:hypothetical protein